MIYNYQRNFSHQMSFHLISDIHLELDSVNFDDLLPDKTADILFIAGDLGNPFLVEYEIFLSFVSEKYQQVFLISGNHEYYNGIEMNKVDEQIALICDKMKNVHFLQKEAHEFTLNDERYVVLGCTLWSHLIKNRNLIEFNLNDFRKIHEMTIEKYNRLFNDHRRWLEASCKAYKDKQDSTKIIVLTHHIPSPLLIAEKYKKSLLNDAFCTDLEYIMKENTSIKWWLCGHSHAGNMVKIAKTTCMLNPFGYKGENSDYQINKKTYIL